MAVQTQSRELGGTRREIDRHHSRTTVSSRTVESKHQAIGMGRNTCEDEDIPDNRWCRVHWEQLRAGWAKARGRPDCQSGSTHLCGKLDKSGIPQE